MSATLTAALRFLTAPLRRAWRVRGFGVHSPFAFGYLGAVIRPRRDACYYAEAALRSARERLIYRATVEARGAITAVDGADIIAAGAATYIAVAPEAVERLERFAAGEGRGVLFVHPGRMAIFCLRSVPPLRLEVSLP